MTDPENLPYQNWEIITLGRNAQFQGIRHESWEKATTEILKLTGGGQRNERPEKRLENSRTDGNGVQRQLHRESPANHVEGFLDCRVEEKEDPLGPISINLPDDPDPNLPGYRVVFVSEHGHESEMFISPDWTDNDDTTRIEQLTIRYTPEQCRMAEIDAGHEAMLRTRADGQENPGVKLLEEYNIRVSDILDGEPWTNISERVMEGEFRKLRITVTLETARQATNRHQEAITNRTHGTQLLLRRQHEDPEYAIREYWALIEDDSGPRLLGLIDNSPFTGITGMDVLGEIITPGQIVWNVCYHAESLPYIDEPIQPEPQAGERPRKPGKPEKLRKTTPGDGRKTGSAPPSRATPSGSRQQHQESSRRQSRGSLARRSYPSRPGTTAGCSAS